MRKGRSSRSNPIRLLSQRERLARIPSGVGWQGLDEIFRETVVARSPETIRLPLTLPDDPWLDLHLGTPEDGAVTFRVSLSSAADDEIVLLERTLTTAHRWETAHVDLAAYGGKEVTLWFSLPRCGRRNVGFLGQSGGSRAGWAADAGGRILRRSSARARSSGSHPDGR